MEAANWQATHRLTGLMFMIAGTLLFLWALVVPESRAPYTRELDVVGLGNGCREAVSSRLEEGLLLLDDQYLLQISGESNHRVGLERPRHRDFAQSHAQRGQILVRKAEIRQGLQHVVVRFAGGNHPERALLSIWLMLALLIGGYVGGRLIVGDEVAEVLPEVIVGSPGGGVFDSPSPEPETSLLLQVPR